MRTLFTLLAVVSMTFGMAQNNDKNINDPEAKKVLDKLSKKYKSYSSMYAEVSLTNENKEAGINQTSFMTLTLSGSKYHMVIDENMVLINDNASTWSINLEDEEGTIETYEPSESKDEITPSNIWTIYENGFNYMIAENSGDIMVIDLAPENKELDYFKIKMNVKKSTNEISGMTVLFKDGTHHVYNLKAFKANVNVDNSTFTFDSEKFPNIELEDLRD